MISVYVESSVFVFFILCALFFYENYIENPLFLLNSGYIELPGNARILFNIL